MHRVRKPPGLLAAQVRLAALKRRIEAKRQWRYFDCETAYFEIRWKPKVWKWRHRFVVIRQEQKLQSKGPVQLDLFVPYQSARSRNLTGS